MFSGYIRDHLFDVKYLSKAFQNKPKKKKTSTKSRCVVPCFPGAELETEKYLVNHHRISN